MIHDMTISSRHSKSDVRKSIKTSLNRYLIDIHDNRLNERWTLEIDCDIILKRVLSSKCASKIINKFKMTILYKSVFVREAICQIK